MPNFGRESPHELLDEGYLMLLQFVANGLCKGGVYALVALGFGLIYTTTRVFHVAHGAVFTIAAYILYATLSLAGIPLPLAILTTLVAAAVVGILIELYVHRPLEKEKSSGTVNLISSLGIYIVLINIVAMVFGNDTKVLRSVIESTVSIGPVILTKIQITQLFAAMVIIAIYWVFLRRTSLGRISRAISDNPTLSSVLGVQVERARVSVFAIGSAMAALGSILMAMDIGMDPYGGFSAILIGAVATILGGLNRFIAPALGAFILAVLQGLVVWLTSAKWETAVTFAVLIAVLLVRPSGLLGVVKRVGER